MSKKEWEVIVNLDKIFTGNIYCIVAWSKSHGDIKFYHNNMKIGWFSNEG